jgi:hypothetical protein
VASKGSSRNPLGKFAESKLGVLGVSLASLGVISGALALPHDSGDELDAVTVPAPAAIEAAAPVVPEPAPRIVRRVYVIRSQSEESGAVEQWTEPAQPPAPAQSVPAQPQPAPAPQPTPQPVTRSRGS